MIKVGDVLGFFGVGSGGGLSVTDGAASLDLGCRFLATTDSEGAKVKAHENILGQSRSKQRLFECFQVIRAIYKSIHHFAAALAGPKVVSEISEGQ